MAISSSQAALVRDYQLNGNLNDALGGSALVRIADAASSFGTLGPSGFSFPANSGLQALGVLPDVGSYSIELSFSFDAVSGYRRIVDFKVRTSDDGLYNLNGSINFFPVVTGSSLFAPGNAVNLILTRDSVSSAFTVYVAGTSGLSFTDTGNLATFSSAGAPINFFRDDLAVNGEVSSGFVDFIRIYDAPVTAAQAACLQTGSPTACGISSVAGGGGGGGTVPEPGTLALLMVPLLLGSVAVKRAHKNVGVAEAS